MSRIQVFTFNPFQENTYLIWDHSRECVIIDPGMFDSSEREILTQFIAENDLKPVRLLNTHCHIDHVLGNDFVYRKWGLKPEFHKLDVPTLERGIQSSAMFGIPYDPSPEAGRFIVDGEEIAFGQTLLKTLFVPGHAPGHIAFYCEEDSYLIAGDVLFNGSVGRVDLPGCNPADLVESIQKKVYLLPSDTTVCPGHGTQTTIGREKISNSFVRENDQNLI
jgi:hydroxyacylglutathione hydrolase